MADDDIALSYLDSHTSAYGVATIRVKDGQMFMFSRAFVDDLIQRMDKSGQERVVVFVKHGPLLTKENLA